MLQQQPAALLGFDHSHTLERAEELQVFHGPHAIVQPRVLGQQPDDMAGLARLRDHIVTSDQRPTAGGLEDRGQHAHGGGFAGTVGAKQRHYLAIGHVQRYFAYGGESAKEFMELVSFDQKDAPCVSLASHGSQRADRRLNAACGAQVQYSSMK